MSGTGGFLCVTSIGAALIALPLRAFSAAPTGLTVEYRTNPVGLDAPKPRLSWRLPEGSVRQVAYEIDATGWKSGRVESERSVNVPWDGERLTTGMRQSWRVRTWDAAGRVSEWSEPAVFTMGVMRPEDWKARWIGSSPSSRREVDFGEARWIRSADNIHYREFILDKIPEEAAELVFVARGRPVIVVNGEQVLQMRGHVYDPDRIRFLDIGSKLRKGLNRLRIETNPEEDENGALILVLRAGGKRLLVTDGTWRNAETLGGLRETDWGKRIIADEEIRQPAFEKRFVARADVSHATLFITGLGFYEASLNGARIGRKVLDPSPTAYDRRVLYSTYDLDGVVRRGENVLSVVLGHGWYDVRSLSAWNFDSAPWRQAPRMIAQLELEYADGSHETVTSDGTWRQVPSPVAYDDIREGEIVDFRTAGQPGDLGPAVPVESPKGRLVAEAHPGACVTETFAPSEMRKLPDGRWIVKFPENIAGRLRWVVRGQRKGTVLTVRYDERTETPLAPAEDRVLDRHFLSSGATRLLPGGAFQTDRVIASGAETDVFAPRFTYHGFRAVVISGFVGELKREDLTAEAIQTDFPATGSFACSDPVFNRLMRMCDRSYRSNFADGYPTDCPHREKNGWTADAMVASELAQYAYENTAAYEKWLRDILDAQRPSGELPGIVPTSGWGFKWGNGPVWDAALPFIAWNLCLYRGDEAILAEVYEAVCKLVDYHRSLARDGLVQHGLGDWVPISGKHCPTPEYVCSVYLLGMERILSLMAGRLGRSDDASKYAAMAEETRQAIRRKFAHGDGLYENGHQSALALALAFDIPDADERPRTERALVREVEESGAVLDVGLIGMKHISRVLSELGRTDLAYAQLTSTSGPSPVQWISIEGTSLAEDWEDRTSRNHIMFGDFTAWAYQYLAGIRLDRTADSCLAVPDSAPGFAHILLAPCPIPALDYVTASTTMPQGEIRSSWRRQEDKIICEFTVPPATCAKAILPDGTTRELAEGTHRFETRMDMTRSIK